MRKSNWLTQSVLVALVFLMGISELAAQETVDAVMKARGLSDKDKVAAVKTFMPRGGRDEYFGIVGTGNSGTMIVYGIPSMRIYKYVGVFTPEPWQGFGFDDESSLLLKKSNPDDRIPTYGDMRFPAFSETNGKYDGKYAFFSDGANARIALLGLDDFETKQVISNTLLNSVYPETAVTPNTEYIVQSGQFPMSWDGKKDMEHAKNGVTFWSLHRIEKEGEHKGRILKEKSFTVEFPTYTLDYNDVGKGDSDGMLFGLANKDGKSYVYALDYKKVAKMNKKSMNGANYIPYGDAKAVMSFIELPATANMVKVSPDGKYVVVVADEVLTLDAGKMKAAVGKDGKAADFTHGSIAIGKNVIDVTFDYRKNVAYASAHGDKKVVRFNYESGKKMDEVTLSYAPSYLMTPQGLSAAPHSNYLIAVDKEGNLPNLAKTGPVRPSVQHLIDISSDKMIDTYTMTLPQANVYGNIGILRTTIKPIIRYPTGTNSRTGEASPYRAVAGQEKIERDPKTNRVHVFGTLIRSHITPEIVTVHEGDIVSFHLTNLERAEDETHGFTVDTYGVHGSFEPGKTASVTFVADRPGAFPYYCTEFCSALHLEMEGILMIVPKGYKGEAGEIDIKLTPEQLAKYKKDYEAKLIVIKQTGDVINSVVDYLKKNNYTEYPYVKALAVDALDQLGPKNGGAVKEKYEQFAKDGKWKQAFLWAEQYFQYQLKAADVGLRAKELLGIKLAEDK